MKMTVAAILDGQDETAVAEVVHRAYVEGLPDKQVPSANSYQHFSISDIEKSSDEKYIVTFDSGDQTEPMTGEQIVETLKGGKFTAGGKKYNTKEALLDERVRKGLDALKLLLHAGYKSGETPTSLKEAIANGILKDNKPAIQAAYWLSQLSDHVRELYSDTDLFHLYWCLYTNWDPNSSDLTKPFPITDLITRAKDINVGESINQALSLGLNFEEDRWEQATEPGNIKMLVSELRQQFTDITEEQGKSLENYLITRTNGGQPTKGMLSNLEEIKDVIKETVKKDTGVGLAPG